jgi:hypothetical protein
VKFRILKRAIFIGFLILVGLLGILIFLVTALWINGDPSCHGGTYSIGGYFQSAKINVEPSYQFYESGVFSWSFRTNRENLTLVNISVQNTFYGPCQTSNANLRLPYKLKKKEFVYVNSSGCAPEGYHRGDPYAMNITFVLEDDNGSIFTSSDMVQKFRCGLQDEKNNAVPSNDNFNN